MRRHVMLFDRHVTRHRSVFFLHFFRVIAVSLTRYKFAAFKTCFPICANTAGCQTLPSQPSDHPHPSPPISHLPPILLAVKLSPQRPAVIFYPSCWQSNSPLPQCFGSGFRGLLDPDPYSESGSRAFKQGQKCYIIMT